MAPAVRYYKEEEKELLLGGDKGQETSEEKLP